MDEETMDRVEKRIVFMDKVANVGKKVLVGTLAIIGGVVVLVFVEAFVHGIVDPEGSKQEIVEDLQESIATLTTVE